MSAMGAVRAMRVAVGTPRARDARGARGAQAARVIGLPSYPAARLRAARQETAAVHRTRRRRAGKRVLLALLAVCAVTLLNAVPTTVPVGPVGPAGSQVALQLLLLASVVAFFVCGMQWLAAWAAWLAGGWRARAAADVERSLGAGIAGEALVSGRLAQELPGGLAGYTVVNNLQVPGLRGDIDHVVLGPTGVFVLETKTVNGVVAYVAGSWRRTKVSRRGWTYEADIDDGCAQIRRNVHGLATHLRSRAPDTCARTRLWVEGVLVFAHPDVVLDTEASPVPALRAADVARHIRAVRPPRALQPADVARLVNCLVDSAAPDAPLTEARTAGRRARGEAGNALVETALVTPVLLMLAFGVVGVSRVSQAQLGVSAVAQEAARVGALAGSPTEARSRALVRGQEIAAAYGLTNGSLQLVVDPGAFGRGGEIQAAATYEVRLDDLPLLGWVKVPVRSTHVELIDLYRSR